MDWKRGSADGVQLGVVERRDGSLISLSVHRNAPDVDFGRQDL